MFLNPEDATKLWKPADLSSLYEFDAGHFVAMAVFICFVAVMKALMFYLILKILSSKKYNLIQPFNLEMNQFISRTAYLALGIGLFARSGVKYAEWLINTGTKMPEISKMSLEGSDVWLFMGIILLVIAQIFKRGMEIQSENELTI